MSGGWKSLSASALAAVVVAGAAVAAEVAVPGVFWPVLAVAEVAAVSGFLAGRVARGG